MSVDPYSQTYHLFDSFSLSPLRETDSENLVKYCNDTSITQYLRIPFGPTYELKDALFFINDIAGKPVKSIADQDIYVNLAIRDGPKLIGVVSIFPSATAPTAGDMVDPVADLEGPYGTVGYWLSPDYHRRGIMSTALKIMIEKVGKQGLGLAQFNGFTFIGNDGSRKTMEKVGFKYTRLIKNGAIKQYPREYKDVWEFVRVDVQ